MQSNIPLNWPDDPFDEVRAYFYNQEGDSGVPIVMVHGSWVDHHTWDGVIWRG